MPRRSAWDKNLAASHDRLTLSIERAQRALDAVRELPVGGTAVGSGINTHPEFGGRVTCGANRRDPAFASTRQKTTFEANAQRDAFGGESWSIEDDRCDANESLEQHSNTWVRSSLRVLRGKTTQPPARQLDYARQSQSGDVRKHDASLPLKVDG